MPDLRLLRAVFTPQGCKKRASRLALGKQRREFPGEKGMRPIAIVLNGSPSRMGPKVGLDTVRGQRSMLQEFKDFIAKGNVMDMAVGIIIGAAFTAIVKSMVDDLLNPIIGLFTGGLDFSDKFVVLGGDGAAYDSLDAAREAGVAAFAYGSFISAVINFLIIAFVVFMLVRYVNKVKAMAERPEEVAPDVPTGPSEKDILIEIRDSLQAR